MVYLQTPSLLLGPFLGATKPSRAFDSGARSVCLSPEAVNGLWSPATCLDFVAALIRRLCCDCLAWSLGGSSSMSHTCLIT